MKEERKAFYASLILIKWCPWITLFDSHNYSVRQLIFLFYKIKNILRKMKLFVQSDPLVGLKNFKSPKPGSLSWLLKQLTVWREKDLSPGKDLTHNCCSTIVS